MPLILHQSILRRLHLPLLFLCGVVGLISWLAPTSLAEPPEHVTVKLTVVVTDGKGTPIPKAHISIPRQGHNAKGTELGEITGDTDAKGEYMRSADFELTGVGHRVVVTVGETSIEEQLPDQKLHDAFKGSGGKITLPISIVTKEVVKLTIAGTVTDEKAMPISAASISIYISGKESAPQFADRDGRFKLANLEFPLAKDATPKVKISATNYESYDEDISDDRLRRNANGTLELGVIRLSSSMSSSYLEELKNITNFMLWVFGIVFILILVVYVAYIAYRRTKHTNTAKKSRGELLDSINSSLKTIGEDLATVKRSMLTQKGFVEHLDSFDISKRQSGDKNDKPKGEDKGLESASNPPAATAKAALIEPAASDSRTRAKAAYENLVNKIPISPEPVYLVVEPPRSAGGKMEDKNTYLLELSHSNGSLVLIADDNNTGWVFPNPKVPFSVAAVKDVFGNLTEVEYESNKLGMEPMRASKVDEARWMLVAN